MSETSIRKTAWSVLITAGILFAALLTIILIRSWGMAWQAAITLALPLAALAQALAGAARYTCASNPLGRREAWRIVVTHLTAGAVLAFLWVGAGRAVATWMDSGLGMSGAYQQYLALQTNLYGIGTSYYLLGVAFHYMLFAQKASQDAQERLLESSMRAREAELSALKAQINPHFLYNSLNSISALTSIDPAKAREMCVSLADFMRMTLGMSEKGVIPLREELRLLEKYCAIEKVRFGERLALQEEVAEDARKCLLPPLLLQPLFENAVVHGIAQMPEGGWIRLRAACADGRMSLTVENSWDPEAGSSRRNGVGLKNVQRRLEARYGTAAQLQASAEEGVFRVTMAFPAEEEKSVASG